MQVALDRPLYMPGNQNFEGFDPPPEDQQGFIALESDETATETAGLGGVGRIAASAFVGKMNEWFVDQFWITPAPIEFGNIVSEKTIEMTVLSTFRTPQSLVGVDVSALGPGITVGAILPINFSYLESTSFDITADRIGAQTFNADIVFDFVTLEVGILATGRRLILLDFIPQFPIQEQMSWLTDIMKSRDGTEQRHSLRVVPRKIIEYRFFYEDGTRSSKLRNILLSSQSLLFGIPLWWEAQQVSQASTSGETTLRVNTTNIDHYAGANILVVLPDDTSFDSAIVAFTDTEITTENPIPVDVPLGSWVVPIRAAYIVSAPRFRDGQGDALETAITFETIENVDLADTASPVVEFPTHPIDGLTILSDPNFMRGKQYSHSSDFTFQRIDNEIGQPLQFPQELIGDTLQPKTVEITFDIASIRKWRTWTHYVRGSWRTFYLPSFRKDVVPVSSFFLGSTTLQVQDTGTATFIGVQAPQRDLMLELPDGRQFFARVTQVIDNGDGTETFSLAAGWDSVSPDELISTANAKISFMRLCRIEGDVATFTHEFIGSATLSFNTRGVQD